MDLRNKSIIRGTDRMYCKSQSYILLPRAAYFVTNNSSDLETAYPHSDGIPVNVSGCFRQRNRILSRWYCFTIAATSAGVALISISVRRLYSEVASTPLHTAWGRAFHFPAGMEAGSTELRDAQDGSAVAFSFMYLPRVTSSLDRIRSIVYTERSHSRL